MTQRQNRLRNGRTAALTRLAGAVVIVAAAAPDAITSGRADAVAAPTAAGFVFVDYDRDGRFDPGERAHQILDGLDVEVDAGDGAFTVQTASDGGFDIEISSATARFARLVFETPAGFEPTFAQQFGVAAPESATAVRYVDLSDSPTSIAYGIVPSSSCPVDPDGVGGPSGEFPAGNSNSPLGKVWTTCFVDGARTNLTTAQDVLVGANYDATGWNPSNPITNFGGNLDVEHVGTRVDLGSVWGVAYDEWDGLLFTSAFIKRHADLGPLGVDGLYWYDVGADGTNRTVHSVALDSLSPADAPSFGDDPPVCPLAADGLTYDYDSFTKAASARGGRWDCRDLALGQRGDQSHDWWAYDRSGREGIGDIDITPDGNLLLVMNAAAETVFVYDISGGTPVYERHFEVRDPGCRGGGYEAWATTAIDAQTAYIGVTCTASESGDIADLDGHVVRLDLETGFQLAVSTVHFGYDHGSGWSAQPGPLRGDFQPWLTPTAPDFIPALPPVTEAAGVVFLDFLDAYGYTNGWDFHQPLLSDIEIDPHDASLVLAVSDRWGMMTGVFSCDLDPTTGGCGYDFPAPPPGDYDGELGDDEVSRYSAGIIGYVAGDLLRVCNTSEDLDEWGPFAVEGEAGCDPSPFSPTFVPPFGGGPAGDIEWYWNDQAFIDVQTENAHPEAAQGAVYIADRRDHVVYTAMNATETFGAGLSWDSNRDGSHENGLQLYRTDLDNRDGTGFKSAGLGDVEGCSVPLEVGNHVWFDRNADGIRDPAEPPIPGVTIDLVDDATATVIATTLSDNDGNYYFGTGNGLLPQTDYAIEFSVSPLTDTEGFGVSRGDLRETIVDVGDADDRDSDVVAARIEFTTGAPGQNNHTLDAGFGPAADLPDAAPLDDRDANDVAASVGADDTAGSESDGGPGALLIILTALSGFAVVLVVLVFGLRWSWRRD